MDLGPELTDLRGLANLTGFDKLTLIANPQLSSLAGLSIGAETDVAGTSGTLKALPVALTVEGPVAGLEGFLKELQQVQPRAVLVRNTNFTSDSNGTTLDSIATGILRVGISRGRSESSAVPWPYFDQPTPGLESVRTRASAAPGR